MRPPDEYRKARRFYSHIHARQIPMFRIKRVEVSILGLGFFKNEQEGVASTLSPALIPESL